MKVESIGNNKTEVKIQKDNALYIILVSYKTPVSCVVFRANMLAEYYRTARFWSVTTSKHINQWLDGAECSTKSQEWFNALLD